MIKNRSASVGDAGYRGSIPGSGTPPREGNSNLLQYSYLEYSMDRGAWQTIVNGVTKESDATYLLNNKNKQHISDAQKFISI